MKVEVKNESIETLLAALQNSVGLHYQASVPLEQRITAHFDGSLEQIITSVLFLNDYNYVLMKTSEGPTLVVFGANSEAAAAVGPGTPAPGPPPALPSAARPRAPGSPPQIPGAAGPRAPGAPQQQPNPPQFQKR